MKVYIFIFFNFLQPKIEISEILSQLAGNKDRVLKIINEEENRFPLKEISWKRDKLSFKNNTEYCLFMINSKYSEMNKILKTFEDCRSPHKDIKFSYWWVYDVDSCFFKKSVSYSEHFYDFLIYTLRNDKEYECVKKKFELYKNLIQRQINFSKNFSGFDRTVRNEDVKIVLSDTYTLIEEIEEYKTSHDKFLSEDTAMMPFYKTSSKYNKAPRLFSFSEGDLPGNEFREMANMHTAYLNSVYSYEIHLENLRKIGNSRAENQNCEELVKIFKYFFDEKLLYKNINSMNILRLDFWELKKLMIYANSIEFKNIFDFKRLNLKMKTEVSITQIIKNFEYICGLRFINEQHWNEFRSYYESNINICSIFLFLRKNNVKKFSNFLLNSEVDGRILDNYFFYYKISKFYERGVYIYEYKFCDLDEFIELLAIDRKKGENIINRYKEKIEIYQNQKILATNMIYFIIFVERR